MARKLNADEEHDFAVALRSEGGPLLDAKVEAFLHSLNAKPEETLGLPPELSAWFEKEYQG